MGPVASVRSPMTGGLRAVLVTPLSGPLARYGVDGADALALWAEEAAQLPVGWQVVELARVDAHPDPAAAMRTALASRPEVIFGPYGSGPAIVALRAAGGRLVWNHGGASSAIVWQRFPRVVNIAAPARTYFTGALHAVRTTDPGIESVALLHGATGFARDVATGARVTATGLGLHLAAREFVPGAAEATAARLPAADLVLVVGGFEDELTAARVLLGRPWRAAAFVSAGVEEVLAPLGTARDGLLGPTQWIPDVVAVPDEGPDVAWFVRRYTERTGRAPSYPAAQAFTAGLLVARCVREVTLAGLTVDDQSLFSCATQLACATLYGRFSLEPQTGLQRGHTLLTLQWQNGRQVAVWPPELAQAPLRYPLGSSNATPRR